MTIYDELIERVSNGETFYINFKNRSMKIGKKFLIADGIYDKERELISDIYLMDFDGDKVLERILKIIYGLYIGYKYSLPSERSDKKRRKYFKALSIEEIPDERLLRAENREITRAKLEGFILCMILSGKFVWNEERLGKWFWQSKGDPDLVILRSWIENN